MNLELQGKVAIVTGASRGIGRAIAETLSAEGMRLVVVARSRERLETLAASAGDCLSQPVDLRDPDTPAQVVAAALEKFGRIDLLVNNAGATKRGDFLTLTDDEWHDGFALKFYGAMRLCRASWPHLMKVRGSIIIIAGAGGRTGSADFAIGGAVNAGLLNLTKVLADRGVRDGVRVNAVNPSSIATDRLRERVERLAADRNMSVEKAEAEMAASLKVARFGDPREVANVVTFLASDRAAYCHGAVVDVDGGLTRTL